MTKKDHHHSTSRKREVVEAYFNGRGCTYRQGFPSRIGDVAQRNLPHERPLTRQSSGDSFDLGRAECVEAVHDGAADLDFVT